MISKVMIKFQSKFQFQNLLQFYKTVEKVETCDDNAGCELTFQQWFMKKMEC